jgi:hypothetical protein
MNDGDDAACEALLQVDAIAVVDVDNGVDHGGLFRVIQGRR